MLSPPSGVFQLLVLPAAFKPFCILFLFTVVMLNTSSFQEQLPATKDLILPLTHITLPDSGMCRAVGIPALNSSTPARDEGDYYCPLQN